MGDVLSRLGKREEDMHALDKRLWTDGRTNGLNTVGQALSEALIHCMCMITLNLKTKIHLKQQ